MFQQVYYWNTEINRDEISAEFQIQPGKTIPRTRRRGFERKTGGNEKETKRPMSDKAGGRGGEVGKKDETTKKKEKLFAWVEFKDEVRAVRGK